MYYLSNINTQLLRPTSQHLTPFALDPLHSIYYLCPKKQIDAKRLET